MEMRKEINWLLQEKYQGKPTAQFKKDLVRLKKGEPLGFIIGFVMFLDCKIDLSRRPLIPRFETEHWVQEAIDDIKNGKPFGATQGKINNKLFILDMFAGSGCIGVSVVRHIEQATMVFAEKDKNALKQIAINCKLNKIKKSRYEIIESDIFKGMASYALSEPQGRTLFKKQKRGFDYIFANPPYIPTKMKNKIQDSVLDYESHEALFAGSDGLMHIRKFLAEAKNFLKPGARIYMEFDSVQKKQIEVLLKKSGYKTWQFHKDQYGVWRYVAIGLLP